MLFLCFWYIYSTYLGAHSPQNLGDFKIKSQYLNLKRAQFAILGNDALPCKETVSCL